MNAPSLRLLLVGYGRMGKLVEALAAEHGVHVAGIVTRSNAGDPSAWPQADVAIDFSTGDAVPVTLPTLAARGINTVVSVSWRRQTLRSA